MGNGSTRSLALVLIYLSLDLSTFLGVSEGFLSESKLILKLLDVRLVESRADCGSLYVSSSATTGHSELTGGKS